MISNYVKKITAVKIINSEYNGHWVLTAVKLLFDRGWNN